MIVSRMGANRLEIQAKGAVVFFSYDTPVAALIEGKAYKTAKKWSVTTSKHIGQWQRENRIENLEERPQEFFDTLLDVDVQGLA